MLQLVSCTREANMTLTESKIVERPEILTQPEKDVTPYSPKSAASSYYSGYLDKEGLRSQAGRIQWSREDWLQYYEGDFLEDSLHGNGTYVWYRNGPKEVYEGYFYANRKEGYGRMSFCNSDVFEGLYKENRRYGPGVLTYHSGDQDVGLWIGNRLARLVTSIDLNIPVLAATEEGKLKLRVHRKLVEVSKKVPDLAHNILTQKGANCKVMEQAECLYSHQVRDPRSLFFNQPLYNKTFFDKIIMEKHIMTESKQGKLEAEEEKQQNMETSDPVSQQPCLPESTVTSATSETSQNLLCDLNSLPLPQLIQVYELDIPTSPSTGERRGEILQSEDSKTSVNSVKPPPAPITHLVAWNNTEQMMDLQTHAFFYRNFEASISFNMESLLSCHRNEFRFPGPHELDCLNFLMACHKGADRTAAKILIEKNIRPDVMDCYGNTGLIFATANDNTALIDILLDVGADVNLVNDEGLSPLNFSVTQYLAITRNVTEWELAFLPHGDAYPSTQDVSGIGEWPCPQSVTNFIFQDVGLTLMHTENYDSEHLTTQRFEEPQEYIFSVEPVVNVPDKAKEEKSNISKPKKISKTKKKLSIITIEKSDTVTTWESDTKLHRLSITWSTITNLLDHHADPNGCDVPRYPLMLAVFSKDVELVKLLLKFGANPNALSLPADGGLTALHVVSMMPQCKEMALMCDALLQYDADLNIQTQGDNELTLKMEVLADRDPNEEVLWAGRTALHTLCMRPDASKDKDKYLSNVCALMLQNRRANPDALYVGHSPLSLAIKQGNTELVHQLLNSGVVNPNQKLGSDLGIPLTFLLSEECNQKLDADVRIQTTALLLDYGADPLAIVHIGDFEGNCVDFGDWLLEKSSLYKKQLKKPKNKKQKEKEPLAKENKGKEPKAMKSKKMTSQQDKISEQRKVTSNLTNLAKQRLMRHFHGEMTRHLLELVRFNNEDSTLHHPSSDLADIVRFVAKWLTPEDLLRCLKLMHNSGDLKLTKEQGLQLVKFISRAGKGIYSEEIDDYDHELDFLTVDTKERDAQSCESSVGKVKNVESDAMTRFQESLRSMPSTTASVGLMHIIVINTPFVVHPELDQDETRYRACFECVRLRGKVLETCPICGLVAFCSKECNSRNTEHVCNIDFYGKENQSWDNIWLSLKERESSEEYEDQYSEGYEMKSKKQGIKNLGASQKLKNDQLTASDISIEGLSEQRRHKMKKTFSSGSFEGTDSQQQIGQVKKDADGKQSKAKGSAKALKNVDGRWIQNDDSEEDESIDEKDERKGNYKKSGSITAKKADGSKIKKSHVKDDKKKMGVGTDRSEDESYEGQYNYDIQKDGKQGYKDDKSKSWSDRYKKATQDFEDKDDKMYYEDLKSTSRREKADKYQMQSKYKLDRGKYNYEKRVKENGRERHVSKGSDNSIMKESHKHGDVRNKGQTKYKIHTDEYDDNIDYEISGIKKGIHGDGQRSISKSTWKNSEDESNYDKKIVKRDEKSHISHHLNKDDMSYFNGNSKITKHKCEINKAKSKNATEVLDEYDDRFDGKRDQREKIKNRSESNGEEEKKLKKQKSRPGSDERKPKKPRDETDEHKGICCDKDNKQKQRDGIKEYDRRDVHKRSRNREKMQKNEYEPTYYKKEKAEVMQTCSRFISPENRYEYLSLICRSSMTHFRSNAQLLTNVSMRDGDLFYKLYQRTPQKEQNYSSV